MRVNRDGALLTLVGDLVAAINLDPVEKKPLYHFLPGTKTLSFGTPGCNMECAFCQNASLSQPPRSGAPVRGERVAPAALVEEAVGLGAPSLSYTYSEPTIFFELVEETARLAHERGLKNILVSNGFMSPDCLDALKDLVDAANIDLKSFRNSFYETICGARLKPVLDNLKRMKEFGWWVEVTTLVIPGKNDSDEELTDIARFIRDELGADTPWHLSRFHADHRMLDVPATPPERLEQAHRIGVEAGLEYVYLGNLRGGPYDHTYCPHCAATLIERDGFRVVRKSGPICPSCGERLAGRGL